MATVRKLLANPLIYIMVAALLTRLSGVGLGLPYAYHWDESTIAHSALLMHKTGSLRPDHFWYPSLYIYAQYLLGRVCYFYLWWQGTVASPQEVLAHAGQHFNWTISHPFFYLCGRVLTACLSTATVGVVYATGRRLYGRDVGLLAALFLTVAFGFLVQSWWLMPHVPAAFFVTLVFWQSARIQRPGQFKAVFLAGLLAGLAVSTRYSVGLAVLIPVTAATLAGGGARRVISAWLLIALGGAIGMLLTSPYMVIEMGRFGAGILQQVETYSQEGSGVSFAQQLSHYLGYLLSARGFARVLSCAAFLGLFVGFAHVGRRHLLCVVFPVCHLLFMSAFKLTYARQVVFVFPFLALLAAVTVHRLATALAPRATGRTGQLVATGVLAMAAALGAAWRAAGTCGDVLRHRDTRLQALSWLGEHASAGDRVAVLQIRDERPHPGVSGAFDILPWDVPAPVLRRSWRPWVRQDADIRLCEPHQHPLSWYRGQGFRFLLARREFVKLPSDVSSADVVGLRPVDDERWRVAASFPPQTSGFESRRMKINQTVRALLEAGSWMVVLEALPATSTSDGGGHPAPVEKPASRSAVGRAETFSRTIGAG